MSVSNFRSPSTSSYCIESAENSGGMKTQEDEIQDQLDPDAVLPKEERAPESEIQDQLDPDAVLPEEYRGRVFPESEKILPVECSDPLPLSIHPVPVTDHESVDPVLIAPENEVHDPVSTAPVPIFVIHVLLVGSHRSSESVIMMMILSF